MPVSNRKTLFYFCLGAPALFPQTFRFDHLRDASLASLRHARTDLFFTRLLSDRGAIAQRLFGKWDAGANYGNRQYVLRGERQPPKAGELP